MTDLSNNRAGPSIAIVGAGPAGLAAAEASARGGARVTVYDRMPSPGRKFLLAGRGGLNLTHTEPLAVFVARYGAAAPALDPVLAAFPPEALRAWSAGLGEPTFAGTSGRVFPKSFKASPLLRAWLRRLDGLGVTFRLRHRWTGWTDGSALAFDTPEGTRTVKSVATVLALGGASWPRLGSDGAWTTTVEAAGIAVAPLRPSNCGFVADWPAFFRERFEGHPLKGVGVAFEDRSVRGEAMVTRTGLEGGAIYALSTPLRETIAREGRAVIHLVLRQDLAEREILFRLARGEPKQSTATRLRKTLSLSPVAVALVNEARRANPAAELATLVNHLPVTLVAPTPIARAISTAGGVSLAEIDEQAMLRRRPGVFVAGEMLDWEAPTGGYLLQACFATGMAAGRGALRYAGLPDAADASPSSYQ